MPITDRVVRTPPTLPTLGSAGSVFTDPTFGSRIARLTDGNSITDLGTTNRSFASPGSGYQQGWNADGTKVFGLNGDGTACIYTFNRTTMATARWGGSLGVWGTLTWDRDNPNIVYGYGFASNGHTVSKVDVTSTTFVTTIVLDLDTIQAGLSGTFLGALNVGAGNLFVTFGGGSQDLMKYVLWYPMANPTAVKILDTTTRNGMDGSNTHFTCHGGQIDKSGRYIVITPADLSSAPYRIYVWDTTLDTVYPITSSAGGHQVAGFGNYINSDTLTSFDATQYIYTPSLGAPMTGRIELINPLNTPQETYAADHTSWNNASPTSLQRFVAGIYRYYDGPNNTPPNQNQVAWRAWDGEVVTVDPSNGAGATVTRYCHHRSQVWPDTGTAPFDFTYTPRANIDLQGQFAMFTSNWEKTLGTDSNEGNKRRDIFIVELLIDPLRDQRVRNLRASRGGRAFAR